MSFDIDKCLFLLGSGISMPSGMPGIKKITNAVFAEGNPLFEEDQRRHSIPLDHPVSGIRYDDVERATRSMLLLLRSFCDQHHAMRGGAGANYEDIYYLAKQVFDYESREYDNSALFPFFTEFEQKLKTLENELNRHVHIVETGLELERVSVSFYAERCMKLIETVVVEKLQLQGSIKGLDLLREAYRSSSGILRVVSLNHDLLLESFFREERIVDGFKPYSKDLKKWNPKAFDEKRKALLLLKPHGSIDWWRFSGDSSVDCFYKVLTPDVNHAMGSDGKCLNFARDRMLLAGVTNKELSYGSGIFLELFYRFHEQLKQVNIIVTSGYGFGDKGINNRVWAWMAESAEHRLVILHVDRDLLIRNAKASLKNHIDKFEEQNRIVFIDKFMQDVSYQELEALF